MVRAGDETYVTLGFTAAVASLAMLGVFVDLMSTVESTPPDGPLDVKAMLLSVRVTSLAWATNWRNTRLASVRSMRHLGRAGRKGKPPSSKDNCPQQPIDRSASLVSSKVDEISRGEIDVDGQSSISPLPPILTNSAANSACVDTQSRKQLKTAAVVSAMPRSSAVAEAAAPRDTLSMPPDLGAMATPCAAQAAARRTLTRRIPKMAPRGR